MIAAISAKTGIAPGALVDDLSMAATIARHLNKAAEGDPGPGRGEEVLHGRTAQVQ